jgi:shikimate dehydrogenase
MHNAALAAVGLERWRYQLLPVAPALLNETVPALRRAGFRGANVTIPHKQRALAIASDPTDRARAIGAANTLVFADDGSIEADNTDAPALIASLPVAVVGSTALVLGAGGSARAAVWALLDAGAAEVWVWNRTAQRARALCQDLGGTPVESPRDADVLVNCTSIGLKEPERTFAELPVEAGDLGGYRCVVDFVYAPAYALSETPLLSEARSCGAAVVDGLELLVGQGALSFELFTGREAPLEVMREAVS